MYDKDATYSINCKFMVTEATVNIVNKSNNPLPEYATQGSSGMDIKAYIEDGSVIVLKPGERKLIHTGLYIQLPLGLELQLRARSGLAFKKGICLANGIGTIDSDYTGEIGVILLNLGDEDFEVRNGDRIAQGVISYYVKGSLKLVDALDETKRGSGGFGHTGVC